MVVLPAPLGPTSAVMVPGSTTKERSCRTSVLATFSSYETASSDASETSSAPGYEKTT